MKLGLGFGDISGSERARETKTKTEKKGIAAAAQEDSRGVRATRFWARKDEREGWRRCGEVGVNGSSCCCSSSFVFFLVCMGIVGEIREQFPSEDQTAGAPVASECAGADLYTGIRDASFQCAAV